MGKQTRVGTVGDILVVVWDIRVVVWDIRAVGLGGTVAWSSHQLHQGMEEDSQSSLHGAAMLGREGGREKRREERSGGNMYPASA